MLKQIAIDESDFRKIITGNNVYVDKTKFLYEIAQNHTYYFLARPRRFGKSLTIDTLDNIFLGNKELFKGLYIDNTDYDWQEYPVIRLDFNNIDVSSLVEIKRILSETLNTIAEKYQVEIYQNNISYMFSTLVKELSKKYQKGVVVLIDEYDKPIISHLGLGEDRLKIARENQDFLKSLYDPLKSLSAFLKKVFITGISKFSKVSIFSSLNNIIELDSDEEYADFLGYTQTELENNFDDHFKKMSKTLNIKINELYDEFKRYYNGFRFTKKDIKVYNPFSVGLALKKQELENYWFTTGTPTFLVNLIKEQNYNLSGFENLNISREWLKSFDIDNLKIESLLFQTGYLTISESYNYDREYILNYPNYEVEQGFKSQLLELYKQKVDYLPFVTRLSNFLKNENYDEYFSLIKSIFAGLSYTIIPKKNDKEIDILTGLTNYELYYHSLFYLLTSLMADIYTKVKTEVLTNVGRLDMLVEMNDKVFIFEFKLDQSAEKAIEQIKEKKYMDRFIGLDKKIVFIGINFSSKEKNVAEWKVESL